MASELTAQLRSLRLYGMSTALDELLAERPRSASDPLAWIRRLLEAEQVERQVRSLRYQLRVARFPIHRELDHFQWEKSEVERALVEPLASAEFTQEAHNLIGVGGTGTAKTQLATALGIAAIHRGKRVRGYNVVDLVNRLEQEKAQGKAGSSPRSMLSSSMSSVTYHSRNPVGRSSSIWSASSTSAPP